MKIYLAHSLTQAPEDFKTEMIKLRELLKTEHEILEFKGLIDGTPEDVYKHDVECVKTCDLLLAEVSYPAIGLGFEIATAINLNKRILCCAKIDAKVSRLVLGITEPNFTFMRYQNILEILNTIKTL